jgi:hypothetical protein
MVEQKTRRKPKLSDIGCGALDPACDDNRFSQAPAMQLLVSAPVSCRPISRPISPPVLQPFIGRVDAAPVLFQGAPHIFVDILRERDYHDIMIDECPIRVPMADLGFWRKKRTARENNDKTQCV